MVAGGTGLPFAGPAVSSAGVDAAWSGARTPRARPRRLRAADRRSTPWAAATAGSSLLRGSLGRERAGNECGRTDDGDGFRIAHGRPGDSGGSASTLILTLL